LWWLLRRRRGVVDEFNVCLELAIKLEMDQVAKIVFLSAVGDDEFGARRQEEIHIKAAQPDEIVIDRAFRMSDRIALRQIIERLIDSQYLFRLSIDPDCAAIS
jgi:hypothetical protein